MDWIGPGSLRLWTQGLRDPRDRYGFMDGAVLCAHAVAVATEALTNCPTNQHPTSGSQPSVKNMFEGRGGVGGVCQSMPEPPPFSDCSIWIWIWQSVMVRYSLFILFIPWRWRKCVSELIGVDCLPNVTLVNCKDVRYLRYLHIHSKVPTIRRLRLHKCKQLMYYYYHITVTTWLSNAIGSVI